MDDFQGSRSALRGRKRKQNRLLNLLIAIVCILILIVGYSIFFSGGGSQKADKPVNSSSNHSSSGNGSNSGGGNNGSGGAAAAGGQQTSTDNGKAKTGSDTQKTTTDNQSKSTTSSDQKQKDPNKQKETSGGPQGPWKPIGTKQQPPHVSSYKKGSVDWNEKMKALFYATGINSNDYILWHLGNGGSPQKSIGKISTKEKPHEMYVVDLKWVDGKGWKPTSVKKVQR